MQNYYFFTENNKYLQLNNFKQVSDKQLCQ